jgi:hypothetical protein
MSPDSEDEQDDFLVSEDEEQQDDGNEENDNIEDGNEDDVCHSIYLRLNLAYKLFRKNVIG